MARDNDQLVDVVRRMAAGDSQAALAEFYEHFGGSTMALIMRVLRSQAEAEELHQEVFVELWRRSNDYDPKRGSVAAWVARIARSRAIDKLRKRQRRGAGKHVSQEDIALAADGSSSPEAKAVDARKRARVQAALAELSTEQREAVELSYFRGLSHSEIAKELELPIGTVKSRILAAMKVLRRELVPKTGEAA